jgi:N-acetylglucosamine repressor
MDFLELIKSKTSKRQSNSLLRLLKLIYAHEKVSRKDIADILGFNKSSVSRNVDQLMEFGFIKEGESQNGGIGRNRIALRFCDDLFYSVGISFAGSNSKIVLLNANTEVLKEFPLYGKLIGDSNSKCEYVAEAIFKIMGEMNIPMKKLAGIGIALPGIFDSTSGEVFSSSEFEGESCFNLAAFFEDRFKCICSLINVSYLSAVIEQRWGKARGIKDFICVGLGYGAGIFMNGQLCRGHQSHAGEFGYMQIRSDGPLHKDGRPGTLGMLAPSYKITDTISDIIARGGETKVKKFLNPASSKVSIPMVVKAIEDGDKLCAQLMADMFEHIGDALVNVAYMFNPQVIFLDEWTSRSPECSIDIARRKMGHYGVSNWRLETSIESAESGPEDFARGAGLLPLEKLFKF